MPYAPPTSLTKRNEGSAPVPSVPPANNQNYRGWPLAKITFGISKKKQDDLNMNVISHSFASQSTSTTSTSTTTSNTTNTNTNTTTNTTTTKTTTTTIEKKDKSYSDLDRDSAIKQVKDILSTSPQLSSSPRRKSVSDSYTRRMSLKVDLPPQMSTEVVYLPRKKSGELVKPSLKKGKSEPTTPTFPKYVHFNTDLEQIKLFREAQKPQAVSAEVSSDDDSDDEDFDFSMSDLDSDNENENNNNNRNNNKDEQLSITVPNMPLITTSHRSKPVFVESVFLSSDKRKLLGHIQVQNIAFQKSVEVRYTFDFWQTVSEVSANYAEGVPDKDSRNSFDLFIFAIELIDNSRNQIDGKTMYFAVRYKVNGRDYWDNNNGSNYQVNFKRLGTSSSQSSSNKYKNSNSTTSSKWSTSTNNRARNFEADSPPVRSPPIINSSSTLINMNKYSRYDFSLSLITAQGTPSINPPSSTIKSRPINTSHTFQQSYFCNESFASYFPSNCIDGMPVTKEPLDKKEKNPWENSPNGIGFESKNRTSNPIAIPSARPAIGSSSYCELVKQYCFYNGSPPVMT